MAQKGNYVSKKKGAKKGTKKKVVDTFSKKEWFDLKAPSVFTKSVVGKTLVTRQSHKQSVDKLLIGRCFEANQADLNPGTEEYNYRKFKFVVEDVRGKEAIGSFYEMNMTTDKARGIIKKWHTLIEGNLVVKLPDGFSLRVFVIGQSRRSENFVKSKCYIQLSKIEEIRRKMFEIVEREAEECNDINDFIRKLCCEKIGKEIEKQCSEIFPLQNCFTKKVMVLKRPKAIRREDNSESGDVVFNTRDEDNNSEENLTWRENDENTTTTGW